MDVFNCHLLQCKSYVLTVLLRGFAYFYQIECVSETNMSDGYLTGQEVRGLDVAPGVPSRNAKGICIRDGY